MIFPDTASAVMVPMITPFTGAGIVDRDAVERLMERFIESGVGAFVLGTTGETASVPRKERVRLVEMALSVGRGRIPLYAGIGDNCLAHTAEAGRRYLDMGVDAVVAHLPSYYPLEEEEMLYFFQRLHDSVEGPIMLYNIPQTTSMSLPMDIVEKLSDLPRFVGFKDSERCSKRLAEAVARFRGREDFKLYMGSAVLATEALKAGFQGLVPGSGNLVPSHWKRLWELAVAQDWSAAEALQTQLDDLAKVFQGNHTLGQSLAALKCLMHHVGLCEPYVLPPLRTLNGQDSVATAAMLARFNGLQCRLAQ